MTKSFFYVLLAVCFINQVAAQTGNITVSVEGIDTTKGTIEIGLYNSNKNFAIYDKFYREKSLIPSKSGVNYTFENIPDGTYAIAVWHDENENKKIDKNWLGIPKENYGFSLNKYGTVGPPKFEDVSFKVNSNQEKTLIIKLK